MTIDATVKRWGNSFGVILPKDFVDTLGLKENDKISLQIVKKADISVSFAQIDRKLSGQDFKDLVRQGWHK